ncbi:MAG: hypothetical protein KA054_00015 [Candidatus Moranbacteria bacterium]|nr:hypothetical protein [Candidatus Moranbacteria bacterium]
MNDNFYNKLRILVDTGRLSVFVVIAPPRSNSSVVEHVLSLSPDIQNACHEPFLGARKKDYITDTGYQQIYESIGGEAFENSGDKTSIVVKEMAHWIGANEEYKKLITLTNHPVVVLVRNPLLTVESRIRRVLKTLDMRPGLSLQQKLLDDLALEHGFKNATELLSAPEADIELILQKIEPEMLGTKDLYHTSVLSIQNNLLDYYARKNGYVNWRDLLDRKLYQERDYKFFKSILKVNTDRVGFEENEFKRLDEIVRYLKLTKQPHVIFDTTDIRAEPENQLRELCSKLGISFSPEMVIWGDKPIDFHTQQNQEYEKIWYEKLFLSSKLNDPNEVPPTLEMFPDFIQKYLRDTNLPIYAHLSREKDLSSEIRKGINDREFRVHVTETNLDLLCSLGVVQDEDVETSTSVKLRDIDPIYAITNDQSLAENTEFLSRKIKYADEIAITFAALRENIEKDKELHPHIKLR